MNELVDIVKEAWNAYYHFQEGHPLLGSMIIAEFTFPFGDAVSQLIKDKKINWKQVRYSAGLAPLYGAGLYSLIELGELVGKTISNHPLAKAALGPNLMGNFYNSLFFVNNTVGEKEGYSLRKLAKHYKNIFSNEDPTSQKSMWQNFKENYIKNVPGKQFVNSVIATLTAWNAFHYFNYSQVPENMRTPAGLAVGVAWVVLLSAWSLKGRRDLVYGKE